eukprot:SAG11_NODE_3111_length_2679_cov_3.682558_1_plen_156_part_00
MDQRQDARGPRVGQERAASGLKCIQARKDDSQTHPSIQIVAPMNAFVRLPQTTKIAVGGGAGAAILGFGWWANTRPYGGHQHMAQLPDKPLSADSVDGAQELGEVYRGGQVRPQFWPNRAVSPNSSAAATVLAAPAHLIRHIRRCFSSRCCFNRC